MTQNLAPGASTAVVGSSNAQVTAGASYANTSGSITSASSTVTTGNIGVAGNITVFMFGSYAGVNVSFEISPDNSNWFPVAATREDTAVSETTSGALTNTARAWTTGAPGFAFFRVRATAWTSGTANVVIVAGTYPFEPLVSVGAQRKVPTYKAVFRTAARPYSLSKATTANTRVQLATIHHASSAVKTVKLRSVKVYFESTTVAGFFHYDLVRITSAPATGNPAVTPGVADNADAAAEATCLALPTTAGTEGALYSTVKFSPSITAAQATAYPQPPAPWQELLDAAALDDERKAPVIRPGVLEGWAVVLDPNVAATVISGVQIEFTEE